MLSRWRSGRSKKKKGMYTLLQNVHEEIQKLEKLNKT